MGAVAALVGLTHFAQEIQRISQQLLHVIQQGRQGRLPLRVGQVAQRRVHVIGGQRQLPVHQLPQARNTASASLRSALRPLSNAVSACSLPMSLLRTTPIATWLTTSMPCDCRKAATTVLVCSLHGAASATRRMPSAAKDSSIAVAAVVAGLPEASSMRRMSCVS